MVFLMKVRQSQEWDIPDLPERLSAAMEKSPKSVAQVCRDVEISTNFWYQVINGNKGSIKKATLLKLCEVLDLTIDELNDAGSEV